MDERSRYRMQRRIAEAVDEETALTLMAHLPPGGWTEVATRSDIVRLEDRMDRLAERMDRLEERMDRLEEGMGRIEERMGRIERRIGGVEGRMGSYVRVHIATSIGAVLATAGAVLAAVNL